MNWGILLWTVANDNYDDHSGATKVRRADRPRLWIEVLVGGPEDRWGLPWDDPEATPLADLKLAKVTMR